MIDGVRFPSTVLLLQKAGCHTPRRPPMALILCGCGPWQLMRSARVRRLKPCHSYYLPESFFTINNTLFTIFQISMIMTIFILRKITSSFIGSAKSKTRRIFIRANAHYPLGLGCHSEFLSMMAFLICILIMLPTPGSRWLVCPHIVTVRIASATDWESPFWEDLPIACLGIDGTSYRSTEEHHHNSFDSTFHCMPCFL